MTVPPSATPFTPSWIVANESQPKLAAGPAPSGSSPGVVPSQALFTYTVLGATQIAGGVAVAVAVAVGVAVGVEVAVAVGVEVAVAVGVDVAVAVGVEVTVAVAVGVGDGVTTVIGTLTPWLSTVTVATALLLLLELKVELSRPLVTVPLVGVIVPLVAL